jgi:mRNA interferase MazF
VYITPSESGLPEPSVINVTQLHTLDRQFFLSRISWLPPATQELLDQGLRLVLGL